MKHGELTKFSVLVGMPISNIHNYLTGFKNACPKRADILAKATGTPIQIWTSIGPVEARRAAIEIWAAGEREK